MISWWYITDCNLSSAPCPNLPSCKFDCSVSFSESLTSIYITSIYTGGYILKQCRFSDRLKSVQPGNRTYDLQVTRPTP
uniref:Uncharacterized protein n=1 Tax=Anguilla anguilla TaxID=7936 RepID=A0A0E9XBN4_ANGAN